MREENACHFKGGGRELVAKYLFTIVQPVEMSMMAGASHNEICPPRVFFDLKLSTAILSKLR